MQVPSIDGLFDRLVFDRNTGDVVGRFGTVPPLCEDEDTSEPIDNDESINEMLRSCHL